MRSICVLAALALPAVLAAQSSHLGYSSYLGGNGIDVVHAIATDAAGNVYLTGETTSTNFPGAPASNLPPPVNIFGLTGAPQPSAFVTKLSQAGQLVYTKLLGSGGATAGLGIAVDKNGSAYVVGSTTSANLPATPGAFQTTGPGAQGGGFVAKLSADGSSLVYATYLNGVNGTGGYSPGALFQPTGTPSAIAVDASGNAYIGGMASQTNFPATPGAYGNSGGAFVAKLNASGTSLVFSTFLGGSGSGTTRGLALDAAGNIYAAGETSSRDFPVTPGALHSTVASGNLAAFIVKLDPAGSHAIYSALLGGTGNSAARALAVDASGSAYIAGGTSAADFPVVGVQPPAGSHTAFVAKLDSSGSQLVYSTFLGGSGIDDVHALVIDSATNVYVTGATSTGDFPVTRDALPKRFAGSPCLLTGGSPFGNPAFAGPCGDAFVTRLDPTGAVTYSTYLSGSDSDSAQAITVNADGSFWVAGATRSTDFPTAGAFVSDLRFAAACTEEASPSSIQAYPCEDGFLARIAFITPPPPRVQIFNTGSLIAQPVSPAAVVTLFGGGIGPATPASLEIDPNGRVSSTLAGTQVFFNGVAAPLLHAEANQITAIVPNSVASQTHVQMMIRAAGQNTAETSVAVAPAAPALLTFDASGAGQAAAINQDGTINSPAHPAEQGSIISLYAVGVRATTDGDGAIATAAQNVSGVQVSVGTSPQLSRVPYAGPSPGSISALTQINVELPKGVTGDQVPVWVLIGGLTSQAGMTIAIH